jgi:hypothetical protein
MGEIAQQIQATPPGASPLAWLTVVSAIAPLALMVLLIGLAIVKGPHPRRHEPPDP